MAIPWENCVLYLVPDKTGAWKDLVSGTVYSQGTAANQPSIVTGVNGLPALSHDGTNDLIEIAHKASLSLNGSGVTALLMKSDGDYSDFNDVITKRQAGAGNTTSYEIFLNKTTGEVSLFNGSTAQNTSKVLSTGQYYTVAANWDTNTSVYIDGALEQTFSSYNMGSDNSQSLWIGAAGNQYYTEGDIQAFVIFSTTLTAAQHAELNTLLRRRTYLPSVEPILYLVPDKTGAWKDLVSGTVYSNSTAAEQASITTGVNGIPALSHDGGDVVNITSALPDLGDYTEFSFGILCKSESPRSGNSNYIFGNKQYPVTDGFYLDYYDVDKKWYLTHGGVTQANVLYNPREKGPIFVWGSINRTTQQLYLNVNGNTDTKSTGSYSLVSGNDLLIGGCQSTTNAFTGDIQAVVIYNSILSATEISSLSKALRRRLYLPQVEPDVNLVPVSNGVVNDTGTLGRTWTAGVANKPVITTVLPNGRTGFDGDGTANAGFTTTSLSINQDWTMFFGITFPDIAADQLVFQQRTGAPANGLSVYFVNGSSELWVLVQDAGSLYFHKWSVVQDENYRECALKYNHSAGTFEFYIEGVLQSSALAQARAIPSSLGTTAYYMYNDVGTTSSQVHGTFRLYLDTISVTEIASLSKTLRRRK